MIPWARRVLNRMRRRIRVVLRASPIHIVESPITRIPGPAVGFRAFALETLLASTREPGQLRYTKAHRLAKLISGIGMKT